MDIHQVLQTVGQYLYMAAVAIGKALQWLWKIISEWVSQIPLPTSIKLFSNDTVNLYVFTAVAALLLFANIRALYLFGKDKSCAKRKQRRVQESKLFRACFFGGAIGGIIGMNLFHHKTLKKKFSIGVPILFVIQLVLDSFVLGFLGFWTFF